MKESIKNRCRGKIRYEYETQARLTGYDNILKNPRLKLHTYLCPVCDSWHLTSQPNKNNSPIPITRRGPYDGN